MEGSPAAKALADEVDHPAVKLGARAPVIRNKVKRPALPAQNGIGI
jgi:hypothetical protein